MEKPPFPPAYYRLPAAAARARVHDGLIVTMVRIVGLCWQNEHRWSPAYTMVELVELLDRPQPTLYRHFKELGQLGWIRVERSDKRFIFHILLPASVRAEARLKRKKQASRTGPVPGRGIKVDLGLALREAGIVGQPLNELLHHKLSPASVRAWFYWTLVKEQKWVKNPAGYIVTRLRAGVQPPPEFVRLAELSPEEVAQLRAARANSEQYQGWPSLDEGLRAIAPLWSDIYDRMSQEQRTAATWVGSTASP